MRKFDKTHTNYLLNMSDQVNFIDLSDFVLQKTLISDDGSFSQVFTAVKKQDPTKIYAVKIF